MVAQTDGFRIEKDSMGEIRVPKDSLWGAQTQRSLQNFRIGNERMPLQIIYAFAHLKKACAKANQKLSDLDHRTCEAIAAVCDEVLAGRHDTQFPLSVWQTGSGTHTNMNCNEVIANRATELLKPDIRVHPNDHVNMSQSSNDTFPSAMHIAAVIATEDQLLPALHKLRDTLKQKAKRYNDIVKIGRTHLQDATPLTLGQEIGGWVAMLEANVHMITQAMEPLRELAIGGTAVGTGLNAPAEMGSLVATLVSKSTGKKFVTAKNKFQALTAHDAITYMQGALIALAANLTKIANDVRWLASGPRCGIGELRIPANEPGSSIMPGKVNPTQCEALTMVACQVFGNGTAINFAASQGNFELNVYKPVIIYNLLQSLELLADAMNSFNRNCATGIEPDLEVIGTYLQKSLMLVTALNPHIGYENAASIAKKAYEENTTLKDAAVKLGLMTAEQFDQLVTPSDMVGKTSDPKSS